MKDIEEQIRLHSAGATVRHKYSFANLSSFQNNFELTEEFLKTWAAPFYMKIGSDNDEWIESLAKVKNKITKEITLSLLGNFNWRTRQTGAFFAAIKNYTDLIDIIGVHFLKSEVCFAGRIYAFVLASFNTPQCVEYLNLYLDYYLTKPDLWFDQKQAMEAVAYLDKINRTNYSALHLTNWIKFIENKLNWNKEINTDWIEKQINLIEIVKSRAG